jgi:metal-sulfur cluster biosynthetic enzyme
MAPVTPRKTPTTMPPLSPAAGADAARPDADSVRALLRQVIDPEVGANIVDMGLIYEVAVGADTIRISMTMTSPACPMGEMILDEVRAVLADELPGWPAEVALVWEPPWNPSMMSERTRQNFGW